jgi:hypothetical protein
MSAADCLYCRPSDLVTSHATWSVASGTVSTDPSYDLTALVAHNPALPMKFTDTPGVATAIVGDFGAAHRVDGVLFPHHNFATSAAVRVQMNDANTWATPSVNAALTVSAARPGNPGHSRSPWLDLRTVAGYKTAGYRYCRIYIPAQTAAPQLAGFALVGLWREFDGVVEQNAELSHNRSWVQSFITAAGVKSYYERNVVQRTLAGKMFCFSTDWQDWKDLSDDAGGPVRPFPFILDDAVVDDGGLLMRLSDETAGALKLTAVLNTNGNFAFTLDEASRGLPL